MLSRAIHSKLSPGRMCEANLGWRYVSPIHAQLLPWVQEEPGAAAVPVWSPGPHMMPLGAPPVGIKRPWGPRVSQEPHEGTRS